LQPNQKKADEMAPMRAKKSIGYHFSFIRLRAAKATTSNQPLANFHRRACVDKSPDFPDIRPTAIEATAPTTAARYNNSSMSDIMEKMSQIAIASGVHSISR
jgi:hypothetical protein